jgi:hypothetical protein
MTKAIKQQGVLPGCVAPPGGDSTGASAEREGGALLDPQPKGRRAWGVGRVKRSKGGTGTTRPHRPAVGWPGEARAKEPTDDPAELHVPFWLLVTFDGTWHLRTGGGATSTPENWVVDSGRERRVLVTKKSRSYQQQRLVHGRRCRPAPNTNTSQCQRSNT